MLRFGKIDQIGDPSKAEEKGMYKVRLDDDDIVTGWLIQLKRNAGKNYDDFSYDENEPVAVMLCDENRTGVILGAMNNKNTEAKETDKDIEQQYFSDDSYVKYDRKNHEYEIYVKSGKVKLKSDNNLSIDSANGKVIINGGNNAGIPIESKIQQNFTDLKTYIDTIKAAVTTGLNAVGAGLSANGASGAGAYNGAIASASFTITDMKDQNATH